MGAKVQSKTHFPGSMMDLNNGFCNGVWDLYHDDKSRMISGPGNSQHFDYFVTRQATTDGYAKEQIRQTILKHESIFRHQLQELHRLYKKQQDLMTPMPPETSNNLGRFLNQAPSSFSLMGSAFSKPSTSKCDISERKVIDLELPADVEQKVGIFHSLNTKKVFNLADLNEPIQIEETDLSAAEPLKRDSATKRTIFGVEICEKNQNTPNFDFLNPPTFRSSNPQSDSINHEPSLVLPWRNTTSLVQNGSILHHNHWLSSSDSISQNPDFFTGNSSNSKCVGFLNGIKSKDSVSDDLEEINVHEKRKFMDMWKNRETPEQQRLPSWLRAKPSFQSEEMNGKETNVYHINLNSLQNHSHQFFKKTEMAESNDPRDFKKVKKPDDSQSFTKILGIPIINLQNSKETDYDSKVEENGGKNFISGIDLNLSLDEEDAPFPESVVKIATMEIDLETPVVLESKTDSPEMGFENGSDFELDKAAAEAIVSISSSNVRDSCRPPREPPAAATLRWFAAVIEDFKKKSVKMDQDSVPEGMDDFEFMTLKLQDSDESYENYKPTIVEEEKEKEKEEETGSFSKRITRKGQGKRGRQRKDFQKDILPSIVTLSRREVTEDIQTFEEAFSGSGVSWQSSLSKRKAAARNGRSKRQLVAADTSSKVPLLPPPGAVVVVEQTVCREVALEKSLGGWGRRTRRLPRQRCGNGGSNHSLALKC